MLRLIQLPFALTLNLSAPGAPGETTPPTSPEPTKGFQGAFDEPFELEPLMLSEVLSNAIETNIDLRSRVIDVEISETQVLAGLGAYDLIMTAGVRGRLSKVTPRGSAFVFSTGSESLGAYLGFSRALESGGTISLQFDFDRTLTAQPRNFFGAAAASSGTVELAEYVVAPTLNISHPLLRGLGLKVNRANIDRARLAASQARANEHLIAQQTVRDVVRAYWDVLYAIRDLENRHKAVDLAERQLELTRAQVAAGRLSAVEAKAVEQSLAVRENEVIVAEDSLLTSSISLRTLMGESLSGGSTLGINPTTAPDYFEPRAIDVDEEIERALANNPQARQLELALASNRIDELEAANQRLPQLDFSGSFNARGRSVDTAAVSETGTPAAQGSWSEAFGNFINEDVGNDGLFADFTLSGQLDLQWDIRNRTAKANHQRARIQIALAELNLQKTQQALASQVIQAARSMRSALKRIDVSDLSVELSESNLEAERARFSAGTATNYDVLSRIDELNRARQDALNARLDYVRGLLEIQTLNGEILPAYGIGLAHRNASHG